MARIVSLFGNQKKAEGAAAALADSTLGEHETYFIEEWPDSGAKVKLIPAAVPNPGPAGVSASGAMTATLSGFDDEEEFLRRSVEGGGVVVVVDLAADAGTTRTQALLQKNGGQLVQLSR